MVGIRVNRLELDEAWSFVGKKQKNVLRHDIHAKGDKYISSAWPEAKAILAGALASGTWKSTWISCTTAHRVIGSRSSKIVAPSFRQKF
jgi:hypothetical protein